MHFRQVKLRLSWKAIEKYYLNSIRILSFGCMKIYQMLFWCLVNLKIEPKMFLHSNKAHKNVIELLHERIAQENPLSPS
jgi:transcription elongation factor GreA-like protein